MRCPTCQARNPDSAEWCSQCYAPLRLEPEPPPPPPGPSPPPPGRPADPQPATGPVEGAEADAPQRVVGGGRFRQTPEGLDWRCGICDAWNPIEATACAVCATPFDRGFEPATPARRDVSESTALVASAAAPGVGHILLGRIGSGISRLVTWLLWFVGGLWLLVAARDAGGSLAPAMPLLAGAVVIWIASPLDALMVARDDPREVLRPRVFLWLVVAVIGAVIVAFLMAATSLPRALG